MEQEIRRLEQALIRADRLAQSGDQQAARDAAVLAGELRRLMGMPTPQPAQEPRERTRTAAQGLTLGFSDEIEARARSLATGRPYEEVLAEIRGNIEAYRKARFWESMAYEMGGAALPAIASFGAGAAPTLGRMAAVGATQGGVYGFGTGEGGLGERLTRIPGGAALGAAGAAVGSTVARAAGGLINRFMDTARRVIGGRGSRIVESEIQRLVTQTGKTPDQIVDDIVNGRILAENETIRAVVRGYRASGGEASRTITEGMSGRPTITREEAMRSMRGYLSDTEAPSALRAQRADEEIARMAERQAYSQFQDMPASDDVSAALQDALRRVPSAVEEVGIALRAETGSAPFFTVDENGVFKFARPPTVAEAESIRRAIANRVTNLYRSGMGGAGEAVKGVEQSLRGTLDVAIPELGATRAMASAVRSQRDAFEAGRTAFVGDVNERLAEFDKITDPSLVEAYRAGLMSAIEARGATGTRQSMVRNLANEETKEGRILRAVLPPEALDDVLARLETARASQVTTDYVLGGSPTAETAAEMSRQGITATDFPGILSGEPAALMRLASNFVGRFSRGLSDEERARIATVLVSQNPQLVRNAIIDESGMAALQQAIQQMTTRATQAAAGAGMVAPSGFGADISQQVLPVPAWLQRLQGQGVTPLQLTVTPGQ